MEMTFKNYTYFNHQQNLTIVKNELVGLTGKNISELIKLISLANLSKGTLLINDNKVTKENIKVFRKRIYYLSQNIIADLDSQVITFLLNEVKKKELLFKDIFKKLKDSLKIVGLNTTYFTRPIRTLSTLEKKQLQLAACLLSNPELIIMEEPFLGIDYNNEKKFIFLIRKLQEKYQKTFVLATTDTEILYKYTTEIIFLAEEKITKDSTKNILENLPLLKKNNITPPASVQFTSLAKNKKKAKIDYHNDIRDIIKDIYKHV